MGSRFQLGLVKQAYDKGFELLSEGRLEKAVTYFNIVGYRVGDSTDPLFRELAAGALFNKGVALGGLHKPEEAVVAYDEVVDCFGGSADPRLREMVAKALVNKGVALGEAVGYSLGGPGRHEEAVRRYEEAVDAFDQVVDRFGAALDPALREQVAKALANKAATLGFLGRSEEAEGVLGETVEPSIRRRGEASALLNNGFEVLNEGKFEQAVTYFDEVLERVGDAPDEALSNLVAPALYGNGITLTYLGRYEEAVTYFDRFLERFGRTPDPALAELVADARILREAAITKATSADLEAFAPAPQTHTAPRTDSACVVDSGRSAPDRQAQAPAPGAPGAHDASDLLSAVHRSTHDVIRNMLQPNERLIAVIPGANKSGLVATDRRILICKRGISGGSATSARGALKGYTATHVYSWDLVDVVDIQLLHESVMCGVVVIVRGVAAVTKIGAAMGGAGSVAEAPNAIIAQVRPKLGKEVERLREQLTRR